VIPHVLRDVHLTKTNYSSGYIEGMLINREALALDTSDLSVDT
jgi:hypothetical protein